MRAQWDVIWRDAFLFKRSQENDRVTWQLGHKGIFSVKSLYNALSNSPQGEYHRRIWKGKIPEKIKIFLWLLTNDAILTKDNLLKRKWQGDARCMFCEENETIDHLFFQCPVAKAIWLVVARCLGAINVPKNLQQCWKWCERWLPLGVEYHPWGISAICWAIWKCRNRAVFDKKLIKSPMEIICHACALMKYWAGAICLQKLIRSNWWRVLTLCSGWRRSYWLLKQLGKSISCCFKMERLQALKRSVICRFRSIVGWHLAFRSCDLFCSTVGG